MEKTSRHIFEHFFKSPQSDYPVPPIPVGLSFGNNDVSLNDSLSLIVHSEGKSEKHWYAVYSSADDLESVIKQELMIAQCSDEFFDVISESSGAKGKQVLYILKATSLVQVYLDDNSLLTKHEIPHDLAEDVKHAKIIGVIPKVGKTAGSQKDLVVVTYNDSKDQSVLVILDDKIKRVTLPITDAAIGLKVIQNELSQEVVFFSIKSKEQLSRTTRKVPPISIPCEVYTGTLSVFGIDIGILMHSVNITESMISDSYTQISEHVVTIDSRIDADSHGYKSTDFSRSLNGVFKGIAVEKLLPGPSEPRKGRFLIKYNSFDPAGTVIVNVVSLFNLELAGASDSPDEKVMFKVVSSIEKEWSIPKYEAIPQSYISVSCLLYALSTTMLVPMHYYDASMRFIVPMNEGVAGDDDAEPLPNEIQIGSVESYPSGIAIIQLVNIKLCIINISENGSLSVESENTIKMWKPAYFNFVKITPIPYIEQENEKIIHNVKVLISVYEAYDAWPLSAAATLRMKTLPINVTIHPSNAQPSVAFEDKETVIAGADFPIFYDSAIPYREVTDAWYNYSYSFTGNFSGTSVMLGTPTLIEMTEVNNLFAVYQTPPFERQLSSGTPSIAITSSSTTMTGLSSTVHKNWSVGGSIDISIGTALDSFHQHISGSYGHDFTKTEGSSKTLDLHVSITANENDIAHGILANKYLWEYPIFHVKNKKKTFGGIFTVVVPIGGIKDAYFPVNIKDFYYDADYENGTLLSYIGAKKTGYNKSTDLLYNLISVPITEDTAGGSVLHYSEQNSTHKDKTVSKNVTFNSNTTVTLWGQSVSVNYTHSTTNSTNQSLAITKSLSLTVTGGSVSDVNYEFQLTPYIYQDQKTAMMFVKYEVDLTGPGWANHFAIPSVILFRVYPDSSDITLQAFSRSIRFSENQDGTVDISVNIFNNSMRGATGVLCDLYACKPTIKTVSGKEVLGVDEKTHLTTLKLSDLIPIGRSVLKAPGLKIAHGSYISAKISNDDLAQNNIYWGIYPYQEFGEKEFLRVDGAASFRRL